MLCILSRIRGWFSKSRFSNPASAARHISLIAGGTVVAQLVGVLTIPILSRIYTPADYGIMAVYASVIAILGEFSGFRYYLAIPLPKDGRYARALVVLSMGLHVAFVTILMLILFISGEFLLTKLAMTELIPYRLLIPLGLFITGTYVVLTQWAIREQLFSTIARTKITQSVSGAFSKIALGFFGVRPLGLLIGTILAQGGGVTTLLSPLLERNGGLRPKKRDLRRVALRYRKFPIYDTLSGALITTGLHIVNLVFVVLYTSRIVGLFAMAQQLLAIPSVFVGQAIGQVFLQRGSVARRQEKLSEVFTQTYRSLMKIGIYPILFLSFSAPQIFVWLLSDQWAQAGVFVRIISPWVAINFIYSPLSHVFSILERQGTALLFEFLHLPLRVAALFFGAMFGNAETSLACLTVVNFLFYFLKLSYLNHSVGNNFKILLKDFVLELSLALVLLSLPVVLSLTSFSAVFFSVSLACSAMLYCFLAFRFFRKTNS